MLKANYFACVAALITLLTLGACVERSESQMMEQVHRQLELRDKSGATIELKTLLQKYPKSAEARFLLGKLLFEAGDAAGARAHLQVAMEGGFAANQVLPLMATVMVSLREFAPLIKQYGTVELTDNRAAAELKTQLTGAHLALKALPEAEAELANALMRSPDYAPAVILSARLKAEKGNTEAALTQVNELLARLPGNAAAWGLKGDLLLKVKAADIAGAADAYEKAISIQADFLPAHLALMTMSVDRQDFDTAGKHFARLKAAVPQHPETLYFEAMLALHKGQPQRVREITDALLRGKQQDPRVLLLAGQAEIQLQSTTKAEALLSKAVKVAPNAVPPRRMLAQLYLATSQPEQAMAVLKPVFDGGYQDAGLWVLMGRGQLMSGAAKDAEASFARAAKLRPDDGRIKASVALARLGQGHGSKAMSELETLAAADAGTTADMALISERMRRKEFDGALKAIDTLAAKQPTQALPDLLRGRVALMRGDVAAARLSFEAALKKEPTNYQAVSGLASADLSEGKVDSARARYQSLVERDPGNTGAHLALAGLASRARVGKEEVARILSAGIAANPGAAALRGALIDHYMAGGDTAQAQAAAQSAVAAITDHPELLDRLAQVQLAGGDINQAIPNFNKMAALQPKSALPHLRLAEAHLANKNTDAAAASVRRALEADPWSLPAQRAGIALALREKRPAQALALARAVQAQRPNDGSGYLLEGEVEFAQKNFNAAMAAFTKAMGKGDSGEAALRLHTALVAAGKQAEAERMASGWLKAHPNDATFTLHLANSALSQDKPEVAEARFREVLKVKPDDAFALNNLAYLLARLGKPGAVELAERAIKLAPNQSAFIDTLALSYAQSNQVAKAVHMQSELVAKVPGNPGYRLNLAKFQIQAGNNAAARAELSKLALHGKDFYAHEEVTRLLKSMGG